MQSEVMQNFAYDLNKIKVPAGGDKVYKDECVYSFDNPESETGLFVCLNTFIGLGHDFVANYAEATKNDVFLHIQRRKIKRESVEEHEPEKKIAKLAIGVEGGFNPNAAKKKYDIEDQYSIVILPGFHRISYPDSQLPEYISMSVEKIIKTASALSLAELEAACWDGEIREVSKHSLELLQLDNDVQIPPSGWKCSQCEKTDNLWLNLTDGTISCGRKQADGSGGNNHAIEHFQKTGYPLSVKLGTITQDGKGDVYSYDENDMVEDPYLIKHLSHFGISANQMEKTEKTMVELEIAINQRAWEWSRITEAGSPLSMKFGPGYTGLQNLGNSCYMNSVMQVLVTLPSFMEAYVARNKELFSAVAPTDVPNDFNAQMSKLSVGIHSGKYSQKPAVETGSEEDMDEMQPGVSPLMFRNLVGKGHSEFSTKKQQDAMEFLEHVLKLVTRNSRGGTDPSHVFKFEVEDKFVCGETGKVKYVTREDMYLPLPVPLEAATNKEEVANYLRRKEEGKSQNIASEPLEQVHSKIPFEACLSKMVTSDRLDAHSSAANKVVSMEKITRLTTFPEYLVIQMVKFGLTPNWEPVKHDVSIEMPDELDLSVLKSSPKAVGEELMPDNEPTPPKPAGHVFDEAVVASLVETGFSYERCKKAVINTQNRGAEVAMNWIMEHMDDPNIDDPLPPTKSEETIKTFIPDEEGLGMIMSMGFTLDQATLALKETSNNLERAADWIFSHQGELDSLVQSRAQSGSSQQQQPLTDGEPRYELVGFISHMGTSIHVGHYVCHIKKDGAWSLFNDNKVLSSENPPKDLGYVYFYKRK